MICLVNIKGLTSRCQMENGYEKAHGEPGKSGAQFQWLGLFLISNVVIGVEYRGFLIKYN